MVRSAIRRMVENWPEEKTFALHGTLYKNVASIRREGLARGVPYICPFPTKRELTRLPQKEVLERAIGSALFAGSYGFSGKVKDLTAKAGDLPAILIFCGPSDWSYGRYDSENKRSTTLGTTEYRSFGKVPESEVPPETLVKVVRFTKKEQRRILSQAKGESFKASQLFHALLTLKTLKALRELVERKAKLKPKV